MEGSFVCESRCFLCSWVRGSGVAVRSPLQHLQVRDRQDVGTLGLILVDEGVGLDL